MADKEQSIVSLIEVLKTAPSIKRIGRQFKTFEEISNEDFPQIIVEEDEGERSIIYTSGGFGNVTFIVNILGYVRDDKNLATAINALDKLVKKQLGLDFQITPTHSADDSLMRSAGLIGFEIKPLSSKSGTEMNPYGWFVRPIQLEYQGILSEGL